MDCRGICMYMIALYIYINYNVNPKGSNHLLRMAMEPKYFAEEVIVHPNHPLTR